jgi:hypothetical protein
VDPLNLIKIILSFIGLFATFICGAIELKKNPKYWLNRFFALTYTFLGIGLIFYTGYHMILDNSSIIIPMNIAGNVFFNIGLSCLIMVVYILDYSEKQAMVPKYLGLAFGISLFLLIGYIFWPPSLNMENYALGIVDTETPIIYFIILSVFRIFVILFVLVKFNMISKKSEGIVKDRVKIVSRGTLIITVGLMINIFSGSIGMIGNYLEIIGFCLFIGGLFFSLRGFLLEE